MIQLPPRTRLERETFGLSKLATLRVQETASTLSQFAIRRNVLFYWAYSVFACLSQPCRIQYGQ